MNALYVTATGKLLSVGTVMANPLPPGTSVAVIDDRLLAGTGRWNPATRVVDNHTPPMVLSNADQMLLATLRGSRQ